MKPLRLVVLLLVGCGGEVDGTVADVGGDDVGFAQDEGVDAPANLPDAASDVSSLDAVDRDVLARDDAGLDATTRDTGAPDAGAFDAGPRDTGARDTGAFDAGLRDTGARDTGAFDAGLRDAGALDAGLLPVPRPADVRAGAECHALIRRLGVRFTVSGPTRGIVDPVTVTPPIAGVHYRYASWTAAERPLLMDCRLAVALVRLGRELTSRWDIDDVQHIGIYNYRTIAGSTRLSQHAYAMAIDIGAFRARNGTTYSVLTDFVMNGRPTCPPRAVNARDRVLKEVACWMNSSRTFHIVLTPNYDSAHRNHYHVDLTTGSNFIQFELPEGVDPPRDPLTDWLIEDD